ncbi:RHS repeat-associated core domain-containing protein [Arthrobacter sp. M4]|uniref:RHS repeat-associated core domain-containing protein n=1 Tax=Arthrobacter sp. M4 TaxID=218160 RepID=UPI001CDBA7CE|nr:RHS repeat-associated core domain-containing protein [Arthrobacter sp. M4]MCA4133323.1 RHS repeat-associated core domain-containing protein [Arthrobacter sp. M4]
MSIRHVLTRTGLTRVVLTGTLAAALIASGSGLATVPEPAAYFTPEAVKPITAVPTANWSNDTAAFPLLTTPDAPGTHATVNGAEPAVIKAGNTPAETTTGNESGTSHGPGRALSASTRIAIPMANTTNDNGSGNFAATPGSSAGSWGSSGQTGGFTWSYPFPLRNAPAGATPALSLSYDSSRVDGLTSATNNQASVAGDGWALAGPGQIRQKFTPCIEQNIQSSYDLCGNPGGQQFTVSFGGRNGQLIKDEATGTWKLQTDDNTKIEYLNGGAPGTDEQGFWRLTDTVGTQYYFGLNHLPGWVSGNGTNSLDVVDVWAASAGQPCWKGSFTPSHCKQAWSWNLDYVVDVNGNSQAFFYTQDTNYYASLAGSGPLLQYTRASRLTRIDYAMRKDTELTTPAPLQVDLGYLDRCDATDRMDCSKGNDVPATYACPSSGTCNTQSPTFYTDKRLRTVTSKSRYDASNYQAADTWTLTHTMPDPGDGTKPALWLAEIKHTGANTRSGGPAVEDPPTVFGGQTLQNRVWAVDGQAPLDRYRISQVTTPTGATHAIVYSGADCTPGSLPGSPETNTRRCFPQYWTPMNPIPQPTRMDYFHIYPVLSVTTNPGPGATGSAIMVTRYEYLGTPAWKYAAPSYVSGSAGAQITWSVSAGWQDVKTISGPAGSTAFPTTVTTYLRGLDQTPANSTTLRTSDVSATAVDGATTVIKDSVWIAGTTVATKKYLGDNGEALSSTVTVPWSSEPTATASAASGGAKARHAGTLTVKNTDKSGSAPGGWRTSTTTNTFDGYGRVKSSSSTGDNSITGDESCTVTAYADNTNTNLLALTATSSTHSGTCNTDGTATGALLRATRTLYDGNSAATPGAGYAPPATGRATRTDTAKTVAASSVTAWTNGPDISYDALGRATSATDNNTGTARITTTVYTPASGPAAATTVTNPAGFVETTTYDDVRGQALTRTDANNNTASYTYDASGRPSAYWDATRPKATTPVPTASATYQVSKDAPSYARTQSINGYGDTVTSYTVYDGLGRVRQTQAPAPTGGTITTDTLYTETGATRLTRNKYYIASPPDGTLRIPTIAVPSSTEYSYDGAGRTTRVKALENDNKEQWSTQISYTGVDVTTTTGPGEESATKTITALNGKTATRVLYHGTAPSGTADTTTYTYDVLGQMTGMRDTANNQWTWTYDAQGRQTSSSDPDSGATATSYDDAGRMLTSTDATGIETGYTYDALDRVLTKTTKAPGGQPRTLIANTYDAEKKGTLSSATRYNGTNFDQQVTTTLSGYTAGYQPTTTTTTLPAGLGTFANTPYTSTAKYTQTGKIATTTSPALGGLPAETLTTSYDALDNPMAVTNTQRETIAGNAQYNNLGLLASYEQYDRNLTSATNNTTGKNSVYFSWDATTGRLAQQWAINTARGTTADLGKTSYAYTPGGKILSRDTSYASRPSAPADYQCFDYDYASHLEAVWTPVDKTCATVPSASATQVTGLGGPAPYAQSYEYTPTGDRSKVKRFDATGNLAATETYTYPAAGQAGPHRLQTMTTTAGGGSTATFAWDAAGRLTNRAGQQITYTTDGLVAGTSGASTIPANPNPSAAGGTPPPPTGGGTGTGTRYYNAAGTLVGITDGTGTTVTIGAITAHATPGGTTTASCTYSFAGKTVAQRTAAAGTVKLAFIVSDRVNTAQTIVQPTNGTTGVTAVTRYTDPMGLARGTTQTATGAGGHTASTAAATGVGSNAANPAGFGAANGYLGGLNDTHTALTHLGARDLDPVLGFFTSPDPVLHTDKPAGFTPYAYSANDPINYSDPSGLDWWGDVGNWFHDNAGTIAEVATAVVVTVVVTAVVATAATACVASVVCGLAVAAGIGAVSAAAGYAVGNAVDVALGNKEAPSPEEYWGGMAEAAGWGLIGGAAGVGIGYAIGKAAPMVGEWVGNLLSKPGVRAANNAQRQIEAARQAAEDSAQATQNLGNRAAAVNASTGPQMAASSAPTAATNPVSGTRAGFIADAEGTIISTSRSRLEGGFQGAGFESAPTKSPGMQYTLPDGSKVRIMEPSGRAKLRASFTDAIGNAINPFTGKQPQPPRGAKGAAWRQTLRELTHIDLGP